jgi:hypothetical protein
LVGRSGRMAVAGYVNVAVAVAVPWYEDSIAASMVRLSSCSWLVSVMSPVVMGHVRASVSSLRGEGGRLVRGWVVSSPGTEEEMLPASWWWLRGVCVSVAWWCLACYLLSIICAFSFMRPASASG